MKGRSSSRVTDSGGTTASTTKDNGMPLMDEVAALIEKERLLLELKLADQQREAVEWKKKYEQLVGKVQVTAIATGDITDVTTAVDIQSTYNNTASSSNHAATSSHSNNINNDSIYDRSTSYGSNSYTGVIDAEEMKNLLLTLGSRSTLDLSGLMLNSSLLSMLLKGPTSLSNLSASNLQVINLSRCSINDSCCVMLGGIISHPSIQALDLSHNDLSREFERTLFESLNLRRKTPQYLLLQGNMLLADKASMNGLLDTLSETTWGLSLTLNDFNMIIDVNNEKSKSKSSSTKAGAVGRNDASSYLEDKANHPKLAQEFLKALVNHIDPSLNQVKATTAKLKTGTIKAASKKKKNARINDSFQSLSVFGLSYCHLNKSSIASLQQLLVESSSSLTDLDISFCYIGYTGAAMLQDILCRSNCQLTRLNLAGNAIGDYGIQCISEGIKKNATMTYLDLRSDNITSAGLYSLINIGIATNRTMAVVDIRCNHISDAVVAACNDVLIDKGSCTLLKHTAAAVVPNFTVSNTHSECIVHEKTQLKTTDANVNGDACIYKINMKSIISHFRYINSQPLMLQWAWKPNLLPLSLFEGREKQKPVSDLKWEVRVTSPGGGEVLGDAGVISHSSCQQNQLSNVTWSRCRAVLTDLPLKGCIEIWVGGMHKKDNRKKQLPLYLSIDSIGLKVSYIPSGQVSVIGGDMGVWSEYVNQCVSTSCIADNSSIGIDMIPKGHSIMRVIRYQGMHTSSCSLTWQMKLVTNASSAKAQHHHARGLNAERAAVGYEWCVFLCNGCTDVSTVAEGECVSNVYEFESDSNMILKPWLWNSVRTKVDSINTDQLLIVTAKAISNGAVSSTFMNQCSVILQHSQLMIDSSRESVHTHLTATHTGEFSSSVYLCHNDSSRIAMPF